MIIPISGTRFGDVLVRGDIRSEMSVEFYATIDGSDSRFDGRRAWRHLVYNLAMTPTKPKKAPRILALFNDWLRVHNDIIKLHPDGPVFLVPPSWFK